MKRLITILLSFIGCVSLFGQNAPMVVAGNVYINGPVYSLGEVHIYGKTVGIDTGMINIANTSTAMLKTDNVIFYSNDSVEGLLINQNTLTDNANGVRGIATATQPAKVTVRKTFSDGLHTYMSLPFTVTANNIFAAMTTTPLTAFTDYGAWGFDAQVRAGYQGFTNNAVWARSSTGLKKGMGYQFQYASNGAVDFVGTDTAEIRSLFANANKDLSYDKYMITGNPLSNPIQEAMDAGWAFIGGLNPTTFALKQANVGNYTGGTIYYRNTKSSQAVTTMQHDQYMEFVFGKDDLGALAANVGPYTPFYIQGAFTNTAGGPILSDIGKFTYNSTGTVLDGTVKFRSSNDESSSPETDQLYFALSSDKDQSFDRFYLSFAGNYSESYRGIEDAIKMTTAFDGRPTVWSLLDGVDQALVVNGLPMKDGREVRMGFSVPEAGDYTIALDPLRQQDVKNVLLLDNVTGKKVDLLQSPYSFNTGAVEGDNGRFVLYINGSYTGTPSIGSDGLYAYAKDNLLTVKNLSVGDRVQVMDLAGRIVASGTASGKEFSVALSQKGVYVVNVMGVKPWVSKVLNK